MNLIPVQMNLTPRQLKVIGAALERNSQENDKRVDESRLELKITIKNEKRLMQSDGIVCPLKI